MMSVPTAGVDESFDLPAVVSSFLHRSKDRLYQYS